MTQDCLECQRLWHDYGLAVASRRSLQSKLQFLIRTNDYEIIRTLSLEFENADNTRIALQRAIRKHEAGVHR
jgi:hypothetical protein